MDIRIKNFDDLCKKGVYCITNTQNKKIYIGSTTDTFKNRWYNHIRKLRSNTHPNEHLQNAYNLYGEDSFIFSILEILKEDSSILDKEQEYINEKNCCDRAIGYNIASKVDNSVVSEETRHKISNTLKSKYASGEIQKKKGCEIAGWNKGLKCPKIGETRRNMFGSVEVYDKNMNLIVTFRSVTDLCEWSETNIIPHLVITGCNKKGGILRRDKIYLSIRTGNKYKGLYFKKKEESLSSEMGIAKWVNCENGEIPNSQPSQPLTKLEGSTTNS